MPSSNASNSGGRKRETAFRSSMREARKFCKDSVERCKRSICRMSKSSCIPQTESKLCNYAMGITCIIVSLATLSYATGSWGGPCEDEKLIARFAKDQEQCAIISMLSFLFITAGLCYLYKIKVHDPRSRNCSVSRRVRSTGRTRSSERSRSASAAASNTKKRTVITITRCVCDRCKKNFSNIPPTIVYI